jgi:hypothetical protein
VTGLAQVLLKALTELEPGVVGADVDAHVPRLSPRSDRDGYHLSQQSSARIMK